MANLTRYNINGEGFTYIRNDSCGQWVKFDDVKELLNTTPNNAMLSASQIIHQLRNCSAEERKSFFDEIENEYCFLCGSEQNCYCAPCYDE